MEKISFYLFSLVTLALYRHKIVTIT